MADGNSPVQWELAKATVRQLYLIENRTLSEVLRELKDKHELRATKGQLELKLKQWKMLKNFSSHVWLGVNQELGKRKRQGKPKSEVIHYGVVLPANKVQRATSRHCLPRLATADTALSSAADMPEMPVWVRTPPASPKEAPWPQDLPWFSFQQRFMDVLVPLSQLCIEEDGGMAEATAAQLIDVFNNPPPERQARYRGPVSLYPMISLLMPESFGGENMVRTEALCQSPRSMTREVVEMIFYTISNNMQGPVSEWHEFDHKLLELLKNSGLLATSVGMFVSSQQPSALAVVDQLFGAAVRTGDAEAVTALLNAGIKPDQMVPLKTLDPRPDSFPPGFVFVDSWSMLALHIALSKGYLALASQLIKAGADIKMCSGRFTTLDFAVFATSSCPESNYELLHSILQRWGELSKAEWLAAMEHASMCKALGATRVLLDHYRTDISAVQDAKEDALVYAIRVQYDDMVRFLLDSDTDPDAITKSGRSALWEAVYVEREDICETLLRRGYHADPVGNDEAIPLQCAAYVGNGDIVKLLLAHGADINREAPVSIGNRVLEWILPRELKRATTALDAALHGGQETTAFYLLDVGASLHGPELAIAIRNKLKSIVDHLLSSKSYANIWNNNYDAGPALEAAIATGQSDIAHRILELDPTYYDASCLSASVHMAILTEEYAIVDKLLNRRAGSSAADPLIEGTALAIAAHFGNGHLVSRFCDYGIKPPSALFPSCSSTLTSFLDWGYEDIRDPEVLELWGQECGWWRSSDRTNTNPHHHWHSYDQALCTISPLEAAIAGRGGGMVSRMLSMGYKAGADSLRKAASINCPDTLDMLLAAGADINDRHDENFTPLQAAVTTRHFDVVNILLARGADVNAAPPSRHPNGRGNSPGVWLRRSRTALQLAVEQGATQLIDLLIEHGADINAPAADEAGATALQLAAMRGFLGVARKLLRLGADVNAPGAQHQGRTALEGAAEHGRLDMLQLLLSHGADVEASGQRQRLRAVQLAERNGHYASARLIKSCRMQEKPVAGLIARGKADFRSAREYESPSSPDDQKSDLGETSELESSGTTRRTSCNPPVSPVAQEEDWFDEFITIPVDEQ